MNQKILFKNKINYKKNNLVSNLITDTTHGESLLKSKEPCTLFKAKMDICPFRQNFLAKYPCSETI